MQCQSPMRIGMVKNGSQNGASWKRPLADIQDDLAGLGDDWKRHDGISHMTKLLFHEDAYLKRCSGTVAGHTHQGGIILDRTVFYPHGGGQPGDSGLLRWSEGEIEVSTTVKTEEGQIAAVSPESSPLPPIGAVVEQEVDWDRRYGHMRVHTALHLLSVLIPLPVTGGSISEGKGRLDFDMPEAPADKAKLEEKLNALIAEDHEVSEQWITDEELAGKPELVKTMKVSPPMGTGMVRLIRIGRGASQIDIQPCGGTHVAQIGEIGKCRIGKMEKKGRQNRRVYIHIDCGV